MRYVSTRGAAPVLRFDDVLVEGLASDGGLYVPEAWPSLEKPPNPTGGFAALATEVIRPFVAGSVVEDELGFLVEDTYASFRHDEVAPVRAVDARRRLLELFWGPTLSFKDYALQLVGAMFERVLGERGRRALVLGATSGDTGSAAIAALADREAVEVVILYPEGRVSEVQRRQMTTVGSRNVRAVAVEGTFDNCQDLVKAAFGDPGLRGRLGLAAVNSINWARVMAQTAYHVWAVAHLDDEGVVAVPAGNFGNVLAADVARRMGAPIRRLVVGNNANHGLATLVESGRLPMTEVVPTLAPAMDIQVPSNLERLLFELYGRRGEAVAETMRRFRAERALALPGGLHQELASVLSAAWLDDEAILATIAEVHRAHGLVIDPHTATAWAAADGLVPDEPVVVVATAHPAKFPDAVEAATGTIPALPPDLADLMEREERIERIPSDLGALVEVLERSAG